MAKDLLHSISEGMSGFSKGQKLIARYIIENYDKAAFMTASKLGNTVGVSESTVVRFATEVGFEGYPQLQRALQELIRNRLTAVQRMEVTSEQMGEHDILSKVLTMDIEKIRQEHLYPGHPFLGSPGAVYELLLQSDLPECAAGDRFQCQ